MSQVFFRFVAAVLLNTMAGAATAALVTSPGTVKVNEGQNISVRVTAQPGARVFAQGLAPGMVWNQSTRTLQFTPDFTQGGVSYRVTLEARYGRLSERVVFSVVVNNNIRPPQPVVIATTDSTNATVLSLSLRPDTFLASPGSVAKARLASLSVPKRAPVGQKVPVQIYLESYGLKPNTFPGASNAYRITVLLDEPLSQWGGYNENRPLAATSGTNPNYTQRVVLQFLSYVLKNYPNADPERVYLRGASQSGTGTLYIVVRNARHFAYVESLKGRPHLLNYASTSLDRVWGTRALNLPDDLGMPSRSRYDLSRAIQQEPGVRDVFFFTEHGANDTYVPFSTVIDPSPQTGISFYDALEQVAVGHQSTWDQRGHAGNDPLLPGRWWGAWDARAQLRRNQAFAAFTRSSANHRYTDLQGTLNRYLAWDSASIVDTIDRFEIAVWANYTVVAPPTTGLPPTGTGYAGRLPIRADVTPRRVQAFQALAGERINWSFGALRGQVLANADGSITVPQLPMSTTPQRLVLTRL